MDRARATNSPDSPAWIFRSSLYVPSWSGSVLNDSPQARTCSATHSDWTVARQNAASRGIEPASNQSPEYFATTPAQTDASSPDKSAGGSSKRPRSCVTVASEAVDWRPLCFTEIVPRFWEGTGLALNE